METTVTGRHLEITDAIRTYAMEKVAKLPRYYDRVTAMDVVAGKPDSHTYEVELIVHAEHHDNFVAKQRGDDLYACIDDVTDKLERQLTDYKEKIRSHKH